MRTSPDEYETMRAIGKACDLTSHKVGKALTDAGLRDSCGHPTPEAMRLNLVRPYTLDENGQRAYRWLRSFVTEVAREWAKKNLTAS